MKQEAFVFFLDQQKLRQKQENSQGIEFRFLREGSAQNETVSKGKVLAFTVINLILVLKTRRWNKKYKKSGKERGGKLSIKWTPPTELVFKKR